MSPEPARFKLRSACQCNGDGHRISTWRYPGEKKCGELGRLELRAPLSAGQRDLAVESERDRNDRVAEE